MWLIRYIQNIWNIFFEFCENTKIGIFHLSQVLHTTLASKGTFLAWPVSQLILLHFCKIFAKQFWCNNFDTYRIFEIFRVLILPKYESRNILSFPRPYIVSIRKAKLGSRHSGDNILIKNIFKKFENEGDICGLKL